MLKATIIAAVLVLAGCSSLRLGYANGPQLAWWWLDGYFDFDSRQRPAVRAAIDRWFAWHRRTELPVYAGLLSEAADAAPQPVGAAQFCGWNERVREAAAPALEQALREGAALLPLLREPQLRHLEQRFDKRLAELRDDYLQPDLRERRAAMVERTVERFERFYGRLDAAQRQFVAAELADAPFDPEAWIAERERRQREAVVVLRRLVAERADAGEARVALQTLAGRGDRPLDAAHRAQRERVDAWNCRFAAKLHETATPEQRAKARERLRGWEADLLSLAAPAGESAPAAALP